MSKGIRAMRTLLIALLALFLIALAARKQREAFANATDAAPWDRRPIAGSVPIDPTVKYPRAYYAELNNDAFQKGLQTLFQQSCDVEKEALVGIKDWPVGPTPPEGVIGTYVSEAYDAAVRFINDRVTTGEASRAALQLPDVSDTTKIQMVHDRLTEYAVAPAADAGAPGPSSLRLTIDVVFYRFAKYHGKHVQFVVRATPSLSDGSMPTAFGPANAAVPVWKITVVAVRVVGIVYADQIGLYPVLASDTKEPTELEIPQGVLGPNAPYPSVLLDENTNLKLKTPQINTLKILTAQQKNMQSNLEAEGAIQGWGTGETIGGG